MKDYNQYVTAINKIFDYLSKMKTGINTLDNRNYIENIEEYKQIVVSSAEKFRGIAQTPVAPEVPNEELEALGNDR